MKRSEKKAEINDFRLAGGGSDKLWTPLCIGVRVSGFQGSRVPGFPSSRVQSPGQETFQIDIFKGKLYALLNCLFANFFISSPRPKLESEPELNGDWPDV